AIFAIFQFEKITMFVFVAQFFQEILGKSPIMSGIAVSLAILPTLGTAILIGRLTDRFGSRYVLLRGVVMHGGAILVLAFVTIQQNYLLILIPLVLWGATMPSLAIPVRRVQMNAISRNKQGQASGINLTVQMLGGSLGFAVCSALLAETHSYFFLFLVIGFTTLLIIPISIKSMEYERPDV
ncbi:MAG: MFS transporter, partial [Hyphomicrobiaceae bacterium]